MKYFFISLSVLALLNANGQTQSTTNPKDEEGIKKVLTAFTDAWNKHDAKAFAGIFSEDADFTNVGGKTKHGRDEIEKHHEPGFKTKWKDSYQKITEHTIRFIKPDVAAVDARWELTGIRGPEGQEMPSRKGLLNFIMTKSGGTWFITVMHNTEIKELP